MLPHWRSEWTKAAAQASSYDTPLAPQQPFGRTQQQGNKKYDRHIPQVLGLAHGDSSLGIRDFLAEPRYLIRTPVAAAGLGGQLLQEIAILFQVEALGDAVLAADGEDVAAKVLRAPLGGDFGHIGTWAIGVELGRVYAANQGIRMKIDGPSTAVRTDNASFHLSVAGGQVSSIAVFRAQMQPAFIVEDLVRSAGDDACRRVAHQPAQELTPELLVAHVGTSLEHLPTPVAAGGEHRGPAA